jgi:HD-like signal output (HDOD) protein
MKNWIARLLGGAGHPAPDASSTAAAAPATPDARADAAGLDQRFWQWLCDLPAGDRPIEPAGPAARLVLDELARLARAPGEAAELVPRVPEVIPRLLRSLRSEDVSGAELAREVLRDAVLVAEVIREANSPFYRPAKPVRTVDAALLVLGQNGLRMLLARVAFRPIMNAASGRLARLAAPRLWLHSERCARAASLLAPPLGADPFEGYLSGLMLDVGLVVAFRLIDQLLDGEAPPQDPALVGALLAGARQLSARIALHWELPPPIGAAILAAGVPDAQPLARALAEADRLARLRLLLEHGVLAASDPLLASLDGASARVFERLTPEPG